ncbi:MAG: hypothetical protein ACI85O_002902, partial [Saprospiraceae bacterium]
MMKNIFLCALCVFSLASCQSDKPKSDAADTTIKTTASKPGTVEELKEQSLEETNIAGRLSRGMDKLMNEYKLAAETIDGFDNPSYTIDEKCNVVFSYEELGTEYAKHFNLGDLEHRNGRMTLEADNGGDIKFPGFRIATGNG